jgi:hypothetical protein
MESTFYIASSRDRIAEVREIAQFLEARGMRNAFDWPEHFDHKCSLEGCGIRDRPDLAKRELEGASTCDLFIGIARLGRGSHVELGAALVGPAHKIILVGVDRGDSVFYDAAGVEHMATVADVMRLFR